jgi:cellulose synthase/poly-beta-1,6-N-acetylglucosamine synthase-like glycosyltransferase
MPVTAERRQRDAAHFEASRRRYQDKFCARRLNGVSVSYEAHCRGEQCKNFAPARNIGIVIPLDHETSQLPVRASESAGLAPSPPPQFTRPFRPLVSCIMPTRNRRPFMELTLRCFDAQDYESRELIIVDDGDDPIEDLVRDHPKVRYLRLEGRHSIGAKRNMACEAARGNVVVHWDDDDWYGPHRITAQVEPILSGEVQFTGVDARWILRLDRCEFWTVSPELHRRMFVGDIHGGTLAYARSLWERGPRFPDSNLAEDAYFLSQAMRRGARLIRVANDELFIYMRHTCNAWQFEAGRFLNSQGWLRIDPPNGFAPALIHLYEQAMIGTHA